MLYYYDGPQRMWRKPLTALKNKNLIPTVKFWKLSVMVWGCTSSKGVGVFRILDEIMAKEVYLDIFYFILNWSPALRNLVQLTRLIRINTITNTIKTMILNINLIDTPAQSPNINPVENLWVHLKKKVGKIH